nr:hypothetical protein CFP56_73825 [Quercus suber]
MGLRTMPWDEWIELDNDYLKFHADKKRRISERGARCCRTDPSPQVMDGAIELLEELASYLPERYPSMFTKTAVGVTNTVTHETFDVRATHLTMNGTREDPMQLAARLVQDDLALMFERADGQYYLLAGAILLAGFWRLEDKFGLPLAEIHTSGDVPGYERKLAKGMHNFFRRVQPDKPVLRNNYFLQVDDQLAWSPSIGSEDSDDVGWFSAEKNRAIEHHFFRSERQSLRRLPRSGAVAFTIRTYFLPVTALAHEDYVPARLASAVRSWGDDVARYKGRERYADVLLAYLDRKHAEQVERGLDPAREEVETLDLVQHLLAGSLSLADDVVDFTIHEAFGGALPALLLLGLFVQPAEVGLPEDGDDAGEDAAVLGRDEGEVECGDDGPDLPGVHPADGDGVADAALRLLPGRAGQQALHAEEVRVEERGEEGLVDDHLDRDAEPVAHLPAAVVEVAPQEQEVSVARDAGQPADEHGSQRAHGFVGCVREPRAAHRLRAQISAEVHDHARLELRQARPAFLHGAVGSEGREDGGQPGPGQADAAAGFWCAAIGGRFGG